MRGSFSRVGGIHGNGTMTVHRHSVQKPSHQHQYCLNLVIPCPSLPIHWWSELQTSAIVTPSSPPFPILPLHIPHHLAANVQGHAWLLSYGFTRDSADLQSQGEQERVEPGEESRPLLPASEPSASLFHGQPEASFLAVEAGVPEVNTLFPGEPGTSIRTAFEVEVSGTPQVGCNLQGCYQSLLCWMVWQLPV
jgi:hypothetical protein